MTQLFSVLLSLLLILPQGIGGKAGIGGSAGFGQGVAATTIVFDNANSAGAASGTSLSFTLTVGSGANRAILIGCSFSSKAITGDAVTVAGTNAPAVSGTTATNGSNSGMTKMYALAAPASGSDTISITWTGAAVSVCGAVSVTGADQTTPVNNGTTNSSAVNAAPTVAITSTSGDLTIAVVNLESGATVTGASNNERWNIRQSFTIGAAGETGTGTGSETLSWSIATSAFEISGANFKHA